MGFGNGAGPAMPMGWPGQPIPFVASYAVGYPTTTWPVPFGVVVFDLEAAHDSSVGTYAEKNIHECPPDSQHLWKSRAQIIEFAGIDLVTAERCECVCRPDFSWDEVRSHAARL